MLSWQRAPVPELKPVEFDMIRELALKSFGLELRNGKERLVAARLGKHLVADGFRSFRQYYDYVRADRSGEALVRLIDALTTNHTSFFRERSHFDFFESALSEQFRNRARIDVWCAASATGEEPYTILMTGRDCQDRGSSPDIRLIASDISTRALTAARNGVYAEEKLAALPTGWISRFFDRCPEGFRVKQELRIRIAFQRVNLIEALPFQTRFSMIFCRNVMIYFNKKTQAEVVGRLSERLEPGGYLIIGHSESLSGIQHSLTYVKPAVFRKAF